MTKPMRPEASQLNERKPSNNSDVKTIEEVEDSHLMPDFVL
uniref:Chromosome partitioning protein ParB n=1 Tax=Heterorhabditis bacteriophora TaxID=37862 RepID=A0A1I7WMP9_HETBA